MLAVCALVLGLLALAGCNDEPEAGRAADSPPGDSPSGDSPSPDDDVQAAEDEEGDDVEDGKLSPPDEPEPSIDLTGPVDEIERIYREQRMYDSWLFRHPDPANVERLAHIVHRDCPCWEADEKLLAHYADQVLWWTASDSRIIDIEVVGRPSRHVVKLHVTWERGTSAELVDETGAVHDRVVPARGRKEILMRRGTFDLNNPHRDRSDDPWKIIVADELEYVELSGHKR